MKVPALSGEKIIARFQPEAANLGMDYSGRPGTYHVIFLLGRPGFSKRKEKTIAAADAQCGDSHLYFARPINDPTKTPFYKGTADVGGKVFTIIGKPNSEGCLARVETEVEAIGFEDAERIAHFVVMTVLSVLSFQQDVPLAVQQTDVVELNTGTLAIMTRSPFHEMTAPEGMIPKFDREFRFYAGMYREALNSESPVYRFLCLFKIIEGLKGRRSRIAKQNDGEALLRNGEILPESEPAAREWLRTISRRHAWDAQSLQMMFPVEYRGKRFGAIIDNVLRPLRNEVAHGLLAEGEIKVSSDDLIQLWRVQRILPMARLIARKMLLNDFPDCALDSN